jgi:hypothetical protein
MNPLRRLLRLLWAWWPLHQCRFRAVGRGLVCDRCGTSIHFEVGANGGGK